ncbi:MAG: hypothetical protein ACRD11_03700 [Terriglobia bacterium]
MSVTGQERDPSLLKYKEIDLLLGSSREIAVSCDISIGLQIFGNDYGHKLAPQCTQIVDYGVTGNHRIAAFA